MNNNLLIKFALDAGLLNYVDNETPRHYFIHGHADLPEIEEFAKLIVRQCASLCNNFDVHYADNSPLKREVALETAHDLADMILEHFGVEE